VSDPEPVAPQAKPVSNRSAAQTWLPTLILNIVLPTVTYFALVNVANLAEVAALLLSGIWPLAEIAYTIRRERHVDEFSVFVLIGIVVGVATTVFSGNARAVFLKDSITTGLIGLVFLVTLFFGRPLTFYLGRRFATDGSRVQRDWWDGLWAYPQFRRTQRLIGAMWAIGMLGEAGIRAFLTWKLGTSAMVAVNNTVPSVIIMVLVFATITIGRRAQAAAARRGVSTAPPLGDPAASNP